MQATFQEESFSHPKSWRASHGAAETGETHGSESGALGGKGYHVKVNREKSIDALLWLNALGRATAPGLICWLEAPGSLHTIKKEKIPHLPEQDIEEEARSSKEDLLCKIGHLTVFPGRLRGHNCIKKTMNLMVRGCQHGQEHPWGLLSMVHGVSRKCYHGNELPIFTKVNVFWSSRGHVVAFNHQRQGFYPFNVLSQ